MSITISTADADGATGATTRTKGFNVTVLQGGATLVVVKAWPTAGRWAVSWPKKLTAGDYIAKAGTGQKAFTVLGSPPPPPPPARLFPDSPFWDPHDRSVDANSAAVIAYLVGLGSWANKPQGTELTPLDWTRSYYEAKESDPTVKVQGGLNGAWTPGAPIQGATIHVPKGARPAAGQYWEKNDGGVFILQPDGKLYSAWRSHDPVDGQAYQWAMIDGNGDGVPEGIESGIGQAKLGPRIGQVTYDELVVAKEIPHALVFEVRSWHGRRWPSWPGDSKDTGRGGYVPNTNAPPMGGHFWLDMSPSEINALSVPEWKKIILRAMAVYGMYTYDNGNAARSLDWESGIPSILETGTNKWVEWAKSVGIPSHVDTSTGKSITVWPVDIQSGVDWAGKLRMSA